jgi:FAD/FMN-containing dehydrogenase
MGLPPVQALPADRLTRLEGWGMASAGLSYRWRPITVEEVAGLFDLASRRGRSVGFRGGGNSYGDAALNDENVVLDLTRMNRILSWDRDSGIIDCEPGVTVAQLWQHCLEDGWWPPVVSGTMFPTVGGAVAANIHGKNNFRVGPIGDHVLDMDLLTPAGDLLRCSRDDNADLFWAVIGGFGLFGCVTRARLQMKRIHSGLLEVTPVAAPDLRFMAGYLAEHRHQSDYLVGWIDGLAGGSGVGRGQIHDARYLDADEDPGPGRTLRADLQALPDSILGLIPKSITWRLMKPFLNDPGTRLVNWAKFTATKLPLPSNSPYLQSLVAFSFLLDYVPNWKWAYKPDGLIQYQSFIPADAAPDAFAEILVRSQARRLPPYLAVFKRHRPDQFLLTHAVDGYSLALDYPVRDRAALWALCADLDRIVLDAGGRFYFAKDSTLTPEHAAAYLGDDTIGRFLDLKKRCDPEGLISSNLYRRVLAPFA